MISFSKTSGYAIHALSCVESVGCEPQFIKDIAECTGLRKPYLAKIINQLVHYGLVVAKRGYRGGICLARPASQITLLDIVMAIEGKECLSACVFGLDVCPANQSCPAHSAWGAMRKQIERLLRETTLADVVKATRSQRLQQRKAWKTAPKLDLAALSMTCACDASR